MVNKRFGLTIHITDEYADAHAAAIILEATQEILRHAVRTSDAVLWDTFRVETETDPTMPGHVLARFRVDGARNE